MATERRARITEKRNIGDRAFWITLQPVGPFQFESGQFLSLLIPELGESEAVWRCYSFANSGDTAAGSIELFVRIVRGGRASTYLNELQVGHEVTFRGPFGEFQYHPGTKRGMVLISTNTGLAPLRSIARSQDFQEDYHPLRLAILGFRHAKDIPSLQEFKELKVQTRFALSREETHSPEFFHGYVTDFIRAMSPQFPWANCEYYICGNNQMIEEVRAILAAKKVPESQIHFEAFEASLTQVLKRAA